MPERAINLRALWWTIAVISTAVKLWLTAGQSVFAIGHAAHDDRLFLQLAEHLVQGNWLGPYDQLTLAKGPFYSLWIAAMFQLGVPLFLSQQLLYAAACAALVRAWRPGMTSAWSALLAYLLLLWNPMSFDASSMGRLLRQHIYSPLVLLVIAGLVGLYYRRRKPFRCSAPWAIMAGLALGCFWMTREEGVWLAPSLVLLAGALVFQTWRESRASCANSFRALGIVALAAALPLLAVSALNLRHYGWFGVVEFRAGAFKDAYGALQRVQVGAELPMVPVSRESRVAAYAVSPAFALLRPHLEGAIGEGWASASTSITGRKPEEREIGGGWMVWALRDAVSAAGLAPDAGRAMEYFSRLATELNAACDEGRVASRGGRRSGFAPSISPTQAGTILRTWLQFAEFVVSFRRFSAHATESVGDEGSLVLFRDLSQDRLSSSTQPLPNQAARDARRVAWLHHIGKSLRQPLLILFLLAQAALVARLIQHGWRRTWSYPTTFSCACWGGGAAYLLLTAIVEVTSYPILSISSFAPAYCMVLLFIAASLHEAWAAWIRPHP